MIIGNNGTIINTEGVQQFRIGENSHYIKGLMFVPGFRAGRESAEQVQSVISRTGKIPFDRIYGAYTYCIVQNTGEIDFFVSNSEMHCIYLTDDAASSSFLQLMEERNKHQKVLTYGVEQICEYYTLGGVFFKKTFVEEISILPNAEYVCIKDGTIQALPKNVAGIDGESHLEKPEDLFEYLAYALSGKKVASALTGGYDSRLVSTMLFHKIPLTLFYATNDPEDPDLVAVKKVASVMKRPLKVFQTEKPQLSEELLWSYITQSDGLPGLSLEADTRILNFRRSLENEGFEICLTGDGGVLHKDWEWMQDLPFYHRKNTNLRRFYHQRIAYSQCDTGLGSTLKPLYKQQEDRFVKKMRPLVQRINTESYDFLYHYITGSQCLGYNHDTPTFITYAPLWELDLVRYSYHLPRRKRFFYNFIRKMTTNENKEIAKVPTNYGTTASCEPRYMVRDIFYQVKQYGEKAYRLIWRTIFHKTPSSGSVSELVEWTLEEDLRELPMTQRAIDWAKSVRYLMDEVKPDQIPYEQLQRLVHIYLLKDKYHISA